MKCKTTSVAVKVEEEVEKQEVQHNTSTKMSTDKNIPKYLVENKGWTEQEAKEFVA